MMKKLCVLFSFLLLMTGCSGEKNPEGMPDLYPCHVTITQAGAPLADAEVTLVSSEPGMNKWPVFGKTDQNGIAQIKTYGKYEGAPSGVFSVTVQKEEFVYDTAGKRKNEVDNPLPSIKERYSLVDKKMTDAKTSPLSVQVEKKENKLTLNVGEKVRIAIPMPEKWFLRFEYHCFRIEPAGQARIWRSRDRN